MKSLIALTLLICISLNSVAEEEPTEVEEIVVSSGISARDVRALGRMINNLANDNDDITPRGYHKKLLKIDEFILEKSIYNAHALFPEICQQLHPHNIQVAEKFSRAGWSLNYKSKNFDTNFIRDYHLSACGN